MKYKNHIVNSARLLLFFVTGVVNITVIGLFLGITVNAAWFLIPAITIGWVGYFYTEKKSGYLIDIAICAIYIFFCILISANVYDSSWDGNSYHKFAAGLLKEGWNPVYMNSDDFNIASLSLKNDNGGMGGIWEESYPKATWYFASVVYKITGNIEAGKCYTLLFVFITFGICMNFFSKKRSGKQAVLLSIVAALNPIVCAQFQSFYLDGAVSCVLTSLIILFIEIIDNRQSEINKTQYLQLFSLIFWGCNLKFSVLVFVITFCFLFCVLNSWKRKKLDRKNLLILLTDGILAVFVFGFAPYVTNVIRHGNMFYSFNGIFSEESMQAEFGIEGLNGAGRFLVSLFSRMSQGGYESVSEFLKIPFTFSIEELLCADVDERAGGFGIFFSGMLLIAFFILLTVIWKKNKELSWAFRFAFLLMVVSIIEFLFLPQTSQFRYIPHMYLCIVFGAYLLMGQKDKKVFYKGLNVLCGILMMANILPWGVHSVKRINQGVYTTAIFKGMAQSCEWNDTVYEIAFVRDEFVGMNYNLKDFDIVYVGKSISEVGQEFRRTYSDML